MPSDALPGWITSNEESVRREAEPYRAMTPAERIALAARASRSAIAVALSGPNAHRVSSYRDPLPASSEEALSRLRAQHRAETR